MENRLYVGNLSDDVSASALKSLFAGLGEVSEVHLATDRGSGRLRGHAFVTMATAAEARAAMTKLDGMLFEERRLRVNIAGDSEQQPRSKSKTPDAAKVTSQFRERAGMMYELDCTGTPLSVKMTPEDPRELAWRLEVSVRGTTDVLTATAKTRGAALEAIIAEATAAADPTGVLAVLDWAAVKTALTSVRAI